jgi:3-isopropylmalate dehydratase small subunit
MKNINKDLIILKKYLNKKKKLVFKPNAFLGKNKYFPPVSKE